MKRCTYCSEKIQNDAKKCKHCGEWLLYNREGYNKEGYNKEGYDRYGYNREGYNKEGYNKEGEHKSSYDNDCDLSGAYHEFYHGDE